MDFKKFHSSLPSKVNLLAVSKGHSKEAIRELALQGQIDFGESKLQEAIEKIDSLKDLTSIRWHFVGRLQRNKVRGVIRRFDVIHSVDSLQLAHRISRIALEEDRHPILMLQIKLRKDPNKGGLSKEDLLKNWREFQELCNVNLAGLMTIAPIDLDLTERRILFSECRVLADNLGLKDCSMGMSRDWHEAIKAGATWIRLGKLLFGNRL